MFPNYQRQLRVTSIPVLLLCGFKTTWLKEMSGSLGLDDDDEPPTVFTAEELTRLSNNAPVRREDKKSEKVRRNLKENLMKGKRAAEEKEKRIKNQEMFK